MKNIFALYLDSFWLLCHRWPEIVKLHGFLQLGCQDVIAMLSSYMLCKHTHRSHYRLSENHHGFNFTWQWNLQDKNSGLTVQLSNHTRINWMSPLVCLGQWQVIKTLQSCNATVQKHDGTRFLRMVHPGVKSNLEPFLLHAIALKVSRD